VTRETCEKGAIRSSKFGVRSSENLELRTSNLPPSRSAQQENTPAGCSKRPSSKAAGELKPEAYPRGYVEDFDELRTKLADFFSILLTLIRLLFHLLLLDQAGQIGALELEAVCCFCLIALRFFDGALDDVAAMFFHRFMVWE
jgi:hypothetical protein